MPTPSPPTPLPTLKSNLGRDDRLRILTLRDAGLPCTAISKQLHLSYRQVQYTCQTQQASPKKPKGQPPKLSEEKMDEIIDWISASKHNRRKPFYQVINELDLGVTVPTLRRALKKRGYTRCKALQKPPLSQEARRVRLAWALEHVNWTVDQWKNILWTDETWVTSGFHTRTWVTRRPGEELDETCLKTSPVRRRGWMFWGSFHGNTKGPCLFWEKEWGSINSQSYCERIVPIIDGYVRLMKNSNCYLQLMQDGAPGHASSETTRELHSRYIFPISWPPFSPDLNPIEMVWNWMKDWIQDKYPEDKELSYDQLRQSVRASWDAIPEGFFEDLIQSVQARCQAVIEAGGGHTPY